MKSTFFLASALILSTAVTATLPDDIPSFLTSSHRLNVAHHPYIGDGTGQYRSACPFLNTAANHNILPYNGASIHVKQYKLLMRKIGIPSIAAGIMSGGVAKLAKFLQKSDPTHPADRLSLHELNIHGHIEHDLSLTRWDVDSPQKKDDYRVSQTLLTGFLEIAANHTEKRPLRDIIHGEHYNRKEYLSYEDVAIWVKHRVIQEHNRGREPDFGLAAQVASAAECALLLNVMGRDGKISVEDAESFLREERFPVDWQVVKDMDAIGFVGKMTRCMRGFHEPSAMLHRASGTKEWFKEMDQAIGDGHASEESSEDSE